jgi:nucleotide-binding universal stress UspA family protein
VQVIRGRHPYPFETLALAVSFSPALPRLIRETRRLCELHNAVAVFVHAGKKTGDKLRELSQLLSQNGFNDGNSRIYWDPGEVVSTVLRICKLEVVDLLIIGDNHTLDSHRPPGIIATSIATKAKCSVLLYTGKPQSNYSNIIINGTAHRKTDLTIMTALHFAEKEKATSLQIIELNDEVYAGAGMVDGPVDTYPATLSKAISASPVKVKHVSLAKENCSNVTEYARKNNADLLVTYSSDHFLLIFDRINSDNGVETMLKNSPCSILIVHSRIRD